MADKFKIRYIADLSEEERERVSTEIMERNKKLYKMLEDI